MGRNLFGFDTKFHLLKSFHDMFIDITQHYYSIIHDSFLQKETDDFSYILFFNYNPVHR